MCQLSWKNIEIFHPIAVTAFPIMEEPQPLILGMENAAGEEVTLRIEPEDDFHTFLDKAKSVLGYDIDLTSLTKDQPVDLNENVYQFLLNLELNDPDLVQNIDQLCPTDDQEYILDDGTEIRASQIHFDNEDAPIDLTLEKLPFIKLNDGDDVIEDLIFEDITHKIVASPINSGISSPKHGFISGVPFKLVCNNTTGFEAQFTRYLENSNKTYATLNPVTKKNKSPRTLIIDNFNKKDDFRYTRDDILNMLKDSPVTSIPYEVNEKKHVRKTDPTRMLQKSTAKAIDIEGLVIGAGENKICFICGKTVVTKLYIFDKEDQKIHRCSPQKIVSTQLKVICEVCLNVNFKPCRMKEPNQCLSSEEYLVIKNNQQYIFKKTKNFKFRTETVDKKESRQIKNKDEFVKVEIGSDGEIVTKPIDPPNDDDVIIINEERRESSSDVEIVEAEPEIDKIIDNLEEADEHVKHFLGKYQGDGNNEVKELKCRFCEKIFSDISEVISHGETHKHEIEDDVVYPCPLCDYGYANFKWLKGHIKAAHERNEKEIKIEANAGTQLDSSNVENQDIVNNDKKEQDDTEKTSEEAKKLFESNIESKHPDLIIKTEVKQECLSSDDEVWIVQTADDVATEQYENIFKVEHKKAKVKKGHKCYNCSKFFPTPATLATHKCKRRGRKRKSDDDDLCIPSKADFMKRAQGRPRQANETGSRDLVERKKTKDHSEIVTCNDCNQSFSSKVRLKFHMQFHSRAPMLSNSVYKCTQCESPMEFRTESELFDHVHFRHDKKKRWQCPVEECGKTFYLRATLTKHSRTHTDTRRYVCVKCGKRFLDKQTLNEHSVTHLQIKPYQCHICLKQLTRVSRLRMHVRAHHERAAPAHTPACAICWRAFRDFSEAQEHATTSTECIETFAKELKKENEEPPVQLSPTSGLVRHTIQVIEHPEPKRIKRQVATPVAEPLLAKLSDEARCLVRVVEIDKAFRCEFCEDVFYIEEGLNKHRAIHKGVKNPFTCHICKVSFATYSRCTTHKTTHGFYKRPAKTDAGATASVVGFGDFPVVKHFLCEDCGRSYLHWTYLQVHRRMKHPSEIFQHKCNHCEMNFPNSWSLAYHRKKIHSNGKEEQDNATTKSSTQNYRIPCRDCDEILPNKNALYRHRKKEHSDMSLQPPNEVGTSANIVERSSRTFRVPPTRSWACTRCHKRFRIRSELRAHTRLKHPTHQCVIEIQGLNPSPEEVLNIIRMNNIAQDRLIEINFMSFAKDTSNLVPNCARALSMLSKVPRTQVSVRTPLLPPPPHHNIVTPMGQYAPCRATVIARSVRPAVCQLGDNSTQPHLLECNTKNMQDLNVLLQDGAVGNNNQIV